MSDRILCSVPFVEAFSDKHLGWRNCCVAHPQIVSSPGQNFDAWWSGKEMQAFRSSVTGDSLPPACSPCMLQENIQGKSLRTAVNDTQNLDKLSLSWPSRWNVKFGNICNLACWTCSEHSSSVIEQQKIKVGLLPNDHTMVQQRFAESWPSTKENILKSYEFHQDVTITVLGGEPLYNPTVLDFLQYLKQKGLSSRTRLEFHTNATKVTDQILSILDRKYWKYISVFFSIDSVGAKAQWLRYGSRWDQIVANVTLLRKLVNYSEVHCTVSVLNIRDLEVLDEFCQGNQLNLVLHPMSTPEFMSCEGWDVDPGLLLQGLDFCHPKFSLFYDLVGKNPKPGSSQSLCQYIKRFDSLRQPLSHFDPDLDSVLSQICPES